MAIVKQAVRFPITVLLLTVALLAACSWPTASTAPGSSSSPMSSRTTACSTCMRAAISRWPRWTCATKEAEDRLLGWPGVKSVYTRVGKTQGGGQDIPEDVVGVIQYEFVDWRERKSAHEILDDLRVVMAGIPGVDVEVRVPEAGPPTGKAIQVRLSAADPDRARQEGARLSRPASPRSPASSTSRTACRRPASTGRSRSIAPRRRNTASARLSVGTAVQLVTNGLKLSEYRPAGVDDAVDIRLRLPEDRRTLSTLDELRVETAQGSVPISNFVERKAEPTVGILNRIDGERTIVVQANVAAGMQVAAVQAAGHDRRSARWISAAAPRWKLAGSNEDSEEASAFLSKAFGAAIFLIFLVLLAQFNKFTSVWLVLSCVVMATIGVFLGLLLDRPGLRHRDVGHRRDRAGRRGGEQQHRADRHL